LTAISKSANQLRQTICNSLCQEVLLHPRPDGRIAIATPFRFPDGDGLVIMAEPARSGGLRLSDGRHTLMHLSYSMDVDDLFKPGNRQDLFHRIFADHHSSCKEGLIAIEIVVDELGRAVFELGQALSQIFDLSFLSRSRVASTFYEDLERALHAVAPQAQISKDDCVEGKANAANTIIDYRLDFPSGGNPLFLFGVHSTSKASISCLDAITEIRRKLERLYGSPDASAAAST
jgi:hypothetical protein